MAAGPRRPGRLILDADDLGSLLVDWLNEVVHLHEARGVRLPWGTARC
jgi:hypothetical protein